jgi:exosortase
MATNPSSPPGCQIGFDRPAQMRAGIIAAAFVAAFWNLLDFVPARLGSLVHPWINEADWSHGPIIPLFSAWLVYNRWHKIKNAPIRYTWVGLIILLAALGLYQLSFWWLTFTFLRHVAMLLGLLGVIIFLCGLPVMRHAWVPWLYLFFAVPLPKRLYFQLTDPLRRMAATVASGFLDLITPLDHIGRKGSLIDYMYKGQAGQIGIADACSGMRSTITLCALGVAVTFLSERPWWQRVIMIASCVPIAVFCNFIRVSITCVLHIFVDPKYATGNYHTALGLVTIMVAFGIFSGLGWVLSNLVVEEQESEQQPA